MAIVNPENILNPKVAFTKNINITNGTHILYLPSDPEKYIENVTSFISSGLTLGQAVVIIDQRETFERIVQKLSHKGFSQEQIDSIIFTEHNEFYQSSEIMDANSLLGNFSGLLEPLVNSGVPIRVWGKITWLPGQCCLMEKLHKYEGAADEFIDKTKCLTVCAYDPNISSTVLMEIMRHHQYIMSDTELAVSGFYKREKLAPSIAMEENLESSISRLKDIQKLFTAFIEEMPDSVFITSKDVIVHINKSGLKLMGQELIELVGKSIWEITEISSHNLIKDTFNKIKSGKTALPTEIKLIKLDQLTVDIEFVSFPFIFEDYLNDTVITIVRDLKERKESEKLAIRNEKLGIAGELAASIAHEIRNPLTAIKGFLKLAKEGFSKIDIYSILDSEIDRIETIASELLVLGKPVSEKKIRSDISELLKSVCTLMSSQANMRGIHVDYTILEPSLFIHCNEEQIKQVFINLIKNGIEAIESTGSVGIQVYAQNNHAVIKIIDNGKGIPAHIQHKLGEPFYSTKEKGTGLGIMVCYRIIEQHNGTMEFSSKEGEGTTFIINLPLSNSSL
ncbi:ATP-binding protein [Metabacillus litoralis]|uniref:ATP-binding protein n=1 Tax=Metabacillus litoralis TaxID=152268 RepID=UPI002041457A|nr:ATP-binding protein [Metabacillus litoralis]MCM3162548.1 ATP-binding protein [Metabacillus litoralis]